LSEIDLELKQEFGGLLSVTGSSYLGVGVNDCIYNAKRITDKIQNGQISTGLSHL